MTSRGSHVRVGRKEVGRPPEWRTRTGLDRVSGRAEGVVSENGVDGMCVGDKVVVTGILPQVEFSVYVVLLFAQEKSQGAFVVRGAAET